MGERERGAVGESESVALALRDCGGEALRGGEPLAEAVPHPLPPGDAVARGAEADAAAEALGDCVAAAPDAFASRVALPDARRRRGARRRG